MQGTSNNDRELSFIFDTVLSHGGMLSRERSELLRPHWRKETRARDQAQGLARILTAMSESCQWIDRAHPLNVDPR
jgi:hypothetical protein